MISEYDINKIFYLKTGPPSITLKEVTIMVPCYVRMNFKKIVSIDLKGQDATFAAGLLITYPDIPELKKDSKFHKHFTENFAISINEIKKIILVENEFYKQSSLNISFKTDKDGYSTYIFRYTFPTEMREEKVFITPFDTASIELTIGICSIEYINPDTFIKYVVKFNCINSEDQQTKFSYYRQNLSSGDFYFCENFVETEYFEDIKGGKKNLKSLLVLTPQQIQNKRQNPSSWQYARFKFRIYRSPLSIILNIFVPLILLALINLAIFFTNNSFKDRVANIATLLLAFTAFIPSIRANISPSSDSTGVQYILYTFLISLILCLLRSFRLIDIDQKSYEKDPTKYWVWYQDPIFFVCVGILVMGIFIAGLMTLIYALVFKPQYAQRNEKRILSDDRKQKVEKDPKNKGIPFFKLSCHKACNKQLHKYFSDDKLKRYDSNPYAK